jgi:hypothetical protein
LGDAPLQSRPSTITEERVTHVAGLSVTHVPVQTLLGGRREIGVSQEWHVVKGVLR